MPERIQLKTKDGQTIIGDYYIPQGASERACMLLHMMPATRISMRPIGSKLQHAGYHALAIDLRGHGESSGGPNGYQNFSDTEHQTSIFDVEAGADYLKHQSGGIVRLIGASIGANLALQYMATHPEARAAVLLSPGLNYKGIATEPLVTKLEPDQAVYFVSSKDDIRSGREANSAMTEKLYQLSSAEKKMEIFDDGGHGTTMFERKPEFMNEVVHWINQH